MKTWITCFILLFIATYCYKSLQGFTPSLPVLISMGALLAIASNLQIFPQASKTSGSSAHPSQSPQTSSAQSASVSSLPPKLHTEVDRAQRERVELPAVQAQSLRSSPMANSISFNIRSGFHAYSAMKKKVNGSEADH